MNLKKLTCKKVENVGWWCKEMAFSHQGQAIQLSVTPYEAAKVKERKGYVYKNCFAWSHLRGLYSNCCKNCKNLDFLFYIWKHQIKMETKNKQTKDQSVILEPFIELGTKYPRKELQRQSSEQRLKERPSRDCPTWGFIPLNNHQTQTLWQMPTRAC